MVFRVQSDGTIDWPKILTIAPVFAAFRLKGLPQHGYVQQGRRANTYE
jgi:hypothetical protein